MDRIKSFFSSIKPKVYKKKFYIGKKAIITLTSRGIRKFLFMFIWYIVVIIILFSMIFGGLIMFFGSNKTTTTNTNSIILPN